MRKNRSIQLVSLLIAAAALAAVGPLQTVINRSRVQLELTPVDDPFRAMPHDVALAVAALGSFRGIAVDYLWIRADRLKDQGKHYEALQLANMICKLQPRFPAVWSFQAWNMAWNISVTTHTPEERWLWVRNGMRLLRDQGIPINPHAIRLYHDLAWIFLNKMGDNIDDMHMAYKSQWAYLMHRLLGPPPPGATKDQLVAALQPLTDAPTSVEQFRSRHPDAADLLDQLTSLGIDLSATYKLGAPDHPLEESFFERYNRLLGPDVQTLQSLSAQPQTQLSDPDRQLRQLLADPNRSEQVQALLAFLRAKVLREHYKLQPQRMIQYMNRYGPLDWRTCDAHAIYWASLGDDMVRDKSPGQRPDIDLVNTRRFVFFALHSLVRRGQLIFVPDTQSPYDSYYFAMPDLRFIDQLHQAFLQLGKDEADAGNTAAAQEYQLGHANFLSDAIQLLYINGQIDPAAKYYDYLRRTYKEPDGSTKRIYLLTLYDFVMRNFRQDLASQKTTESILYDTLWQAYQELALGNAPLYDSRVNWSKRIYDEYMKDKREDMTARRQLPPFPDMLANALYTYLQFGPLHDVYKVRLWDVASTPLKQRIYDQLEPALNQICQRNNWNQAKAFPEPPGMEQYRRTHAPPPQQEPQPAAPQLKL